VSGRAVRTANIARTFIGNWSLALTAGLGMTECDGASACPRMNRRSG